MLEFLHGVLGLSVEHRIQVPVVETQQRKVVLQLRDVVAVQRGHLVEEQWTVTQPVLGVVECCLGLRTDHAVHDEPLALLEHPHGVVHTVVEDRGVRHAVAGQG